MAHEKYHEAVIPNFFFRLRYTLLTFQPKTFNTVDGADTQIAFLLKSLQASKTANKMQAIKCLVCFSITWCSVIISCDWSTVPRVIPQYHHTFSVIGLVLQVA